MFIFQLRRGVLLQGFHPWGKQKHGWILKMFGFTLKWSHPESTVWFETSIIFTVFQFKCVLWAKRFRLVVPQPPSATLDPEQAKLLMDAVNEGKLIYSSPHPTGKALSASPFWGTFSKWKAEGMPDAWSDMSGMDRAASMLDKIKKERENSCPSNSQ